MFFRAFLVSGAIAVLTVSRALCCEHQVFVEKGSTVDIHSPGYEQGSYQLNIHCKWNISTASYAKLKLTFSEFNIEYHMLCVWDYILVYNGTCGSGGDVKRYCGKSVPSNIFSNNAEACLEFHSDAYVVKPGFQLLVTSEAASQQEQSSTTTSPVQLSPIPSTSLSTSPTTSPVSSSIQTSTSSVPSTTSSSTPTLPSSSQPSVQTLLMGPLSTSSGDPTIVEMCKDVTWYQAEHEAMVISPGYAKSQNYGNDRNCHLKILNPGKKVLKFSFIDFHVEKHPTCFWDKLKVTEGQGQVLATICGVSVDTPDNLESSAENINLVFISDNVVNWKGFQINLTIQHSVTPTTSLPPVTPSTFVTQSKTTSSPKISPTTITPSPSPIPTDTTIQTIYVTSADVAPTVEMCKDTSLVYSGAEGYVLSPHYSSGNNYELDQDCVLQIINTQDQLVEFTFEDFALEHHPLCDWDYVEFRAGLGTDSPVLARLCGDTPSSPLTTSSSVIVVKFCSDSINAFKGFKIKYVISSASTGQPSLSTVSTTPSLIDSSSMLTTASPTSATNHVTTPVPDHVTDLIILDNGFQQTYVKETVTVFSPNFGPGKTYPVSVTCGLKLQSLNNRKISVNVLDFKVEYHPSCSWDRLSIYDGPSKSSALLGTYCGVKSGVAVNSSGTALFLEFVSDNIVPDKGFQLDISTKIEQSDNTTASSSTGSPTKATDVVTPLLQSSTSPTTETSTLTSSVMNPTSSPTVDDYVTTVSDPNSQSTSPSKTSSTIDPQSISTSVIFSTPIPPTTSLHMCGGSDVLDMDQSVDVFSPNFGNGKTYPINTQCGLLIRAKSHQLLKMDIITLDVEVHASCAWDSLRVYDGPDINAALLGYYCGVPAKTELHSSSSTLYLLFQSDSVVTAPGFHLTLSVIGAATVKPTTTATPSTVPTTTPTTTPSTIPTPTPSTIPTTMPTTTPSTIPTTTPTTTPSTISTPTTTPLTIPTTTPTTTPSTIPTTTPTTTPSTIPTTTPTTTPSTIPTTTPTTTPSTIPTTTSKTTSTTISTTTPTSTTTTASPPTSIDVVVELCGEKTAIDLPTRGMYITSPNYGSGNYPTNTECSLTVNASQTQAIYVEILFMDIEENHICSWDSLSIYDGPTTKSNRLVKLCGSGLPQPLQSSSNFLHLRFESDNVFPRKGFKAKLTVVQDSPTLSTTPPTTSLKTTLPMTTKSLSTTTQKTSSTTQVATTGTTTPVTTASTTKATTTIKALTSLKTSSKAPTTTTTTTTTSSTTTTSLPIGHTTTAASMQDLPLECLGVPQVHTLPSGIIQSPGADNGNPYPRSATCEWVIIAAVNRVIELTFVEFDLEAEPNCNADRVTIHDAPTSVGQLLSTSCGNNSPGNVTSTTNALFISLTSNNHVEKNGFKANYTTIAKEAPPPSCLAGEYACTSGECIPEEWLCDGEADCTDTGDELSCQMCLDGEFRCGNAKCISGLLRCDGHDDCVEGLDEHNCLSIGSDQSVRVMYHSQWYPVCSDDWSSDASDVICQQLVFSDSTSMTPANSNNMVFMTLKDDSPVTSNSIHTIFEPTISCNSGQKVQLQCEHNGCGVRSPNLITPYVIGGTKSFPGQWPWMVAIKINHKFICGGTLIGHHWVATASHCIESVSARPYILNVMIGSIAMNPADVVYFKVTEVIIHPDNNFIYQADLALLRLQKPVIFTDLVKPLCLATESHALTGSSICYVSGWGVLTVADIYSTVMPEYLQHAKMKLVTQSKCKDAYQGRINGTMLCAGYDLGRIDSCKGDSGGPLMCKVSSDRWVLAGITSWGETPCGQAKKPGVYTRVDKYKDWITSITADAGTQHNCTYEAPGLCGHIDVSRAGFMWTRRSRDPTFDYTWGNATGHFLYAENPHDLSTLYHEAILKIPPFLKNGVKCMSLAVFFYGSQSDMKLKIMGHVTPNVIRQLSEISSFSSSWAVAHVTIDDDITAIDIVAVRGVRKNVGVAIDDVMFAEGHCPDTVKLRCTFDWGNTCLYTNDKDDIHDWSLQSAQTGYILEFAGGGKYPGDKARFSSPIMTTSIPRCVKFSFQICPQSSGILSLLTQVDFGGVSLLRAPVWTTQLSNCNNWTLAQVDVDHQSHPFGLALEASRGLYPGSIRVDDISISHGNCF